MTWEVSSYATSGTIMIFRGVYVMADLSHVQGTYEERLARARLICALFNGHNAMMYGVGRKKEAS